MSRSNPSTCLPALLFSLLFVAGCKTAPPKGLIGYSYTVQIGDSLDTVTREYQKQGVAVTPDQILCAKLSEIYFFFFAAHIALAAAAIFALASGLMTRLTTAFFTTGLAVDLTAGFAAPLIFAHLALAAALILALAAALIVNLFFAGLTAAGFSLSALTLAQRNI